MVTHEDIRRHTLALPEVEEGVHFNLPAFKVRGKVFVVAQKGNTHAILSVSPEDAREITAEKQQSVEEVWRSEKIFVGIRVDLSRVQSAEISAWIKQAWTNKAPKSLQGQLE